MSDLFSADWMASYKNEWNNEPALSKALSEINFDSVIGYGFPDEDQPRGVISVKNGEAVDAGCYDGQEMNWDLRASTDQWAKWMGKPPGMVALGLAFTSGKLKFKVGDYGAMLKDPRMASPFIKAFSVMGKA